MNSSCLRGLMGIVVGVFLIAGSELSVAEKGGRNMPNPTNMVVVTQDFEGVVFAAEKKAFHWEFEGSVTYWTPSQFEIVHAESLISSYLKEKAPAIYSKLKTYKRQYVGFVRDGRKCIYANFFCNDHRMVWKTEELIVKDGGDCYFQIKVDLTQNRCFDLHVNGEA